MGNGRQSHKCRLIRLLISKFLAWSVQVCRICEGLLYLLLLSLSSFYVEGKLYWGTDRIFFVERALGFNNHPERIVSPPRQGTSSLTFFFDFSSPWSFLAMERLEDVISSVSPVAVKVEFVPVLLGALFKDIGTPMVRGFVLSAQLCYVDDHCRYRLLL